MLNWYLVPLEKQIRYGHLSVLPDVASLTEEKVADLVKIIQTAKDADTGKSTDGEAVNVLHVALMEVRAYARRRGMHIGLCRNVEVSVRKVATVCRSIR